MNTQLWRALEYQLILVACIGIAQAAVAQIVPDQSLPVGERSQVSGGSNVDINGGATRGGNLFHSFQQFSIPTGGSASFNYAGKITNIITRITGNTRSDIDGLIRSNGNANVFLINPNGIDFGANARLEIGGSFLASTANSLNFADGFEFSATASQTASLLTISMPIGLQFGTSASAILVKGYGQTIRPFVPNSPLIDTTAGLHVPFNQTLALVGGEIALEGATLKTAGGRIELGSVGGGSVVRLTPINKGFALSYDAVPNFGDIQLFQQAYVDASGEGGGDISIQGGRVTLTGASSIEASTLGSKPGGTFTINARSSLEIVGGDTLPEESGLFAVTYPGTTGAGGNLTINTPTLLVRNGGEIAVSTFAAGNSGNLTVNAPQQVSLIGTSVDGQVRSGLFARANGTIGAAGDLTINTGTLFVQGGAEASAGTRSAGNGGDLTVNATQGVQLVGITPGNDEFSSGLFAQANQGATGAAGNLSITTPTLLVQSGALVAAGTFGQGTGGSLIVNATQGVQLIGTSPDGVQPSGLFLISSSGSTGAAGDLTIHTPTLLVRDGAALSVATLGSGKAGNLTVIAPDSVQVTGRSFNNKYPSALFASSNQTNSSGTAGNLTINTGSLLVQNGAELSTSSQGQGHAGNLEVNARQIRLDNQGSIQSQTALGQGGNIRLQVQDLLLLRRGSSISTTAGTVQAGGDGGNITFNGNFIVAVPNENSDISANAFTGKGGNIQINAQGIYGTQFRPSATPLSDITASSQYGVNGTVRLNTPNVIPIRGTVALPTRLIDTDALIANSCVARSRHQGRFIITGMGGLSTQPDDLAIASFPTYELIPDAGKLGTTNSPQQSSSSVVESNGIYRLTTGEVVLGRSCQ